MLRKRYIITRTIKYKFIHPGKVINLFNLQFFRELLNVLNRYEDLKQEMNEEQEKIRKEKMEIYLHYTKKIDEYELTI